MSIRKASTVLHNAVMSFLIGSLLLGPLPFQAQAAVTSIDMIYLVDESGSMGGEQAWLAQQVPLIDQELISHGLTNNMYGLIGFGDSNPVPRQVDVAGGQFGTAAEFATAIGTLNTNGGWEDGYSAIDFAVNNYQFRAGVGAILVLVTDEDRDILNAATYPNGPNLDYNSILADLQSRNIALTTIINQQIFKADGTTVALVMNGAGMVSVADGAGGLTQDSPSPNGVFGSGYGTTTADYANLSQALQSCVGDLNQLRNGGVTGESFAIAFIQCVAATAENQAPVQPGGLTPFTVTPGCVGMMTAAAMSMIHLSGFNIDSRLNALRRAGPMMASLNQLNGEAVGEFDADTEPDAFRGQGGVTGGGMGTDSTWGFFAIGATSSGEHLDTENLVGGDFEIQDLTVGADYRVDDNLVLGLAFGTDTSETDFDDFSFLKSTTVTMGGYGTLLLGDNLYLDGMVSFGMSDLETARRVPGNVVATGDTDAKVLSSKLRLVYEEHIDNFTISPELEVHYAYAEVGDYAEHGAGGASLNVDRQTAQSLTTGLGAKVYYQTEVRGIPLVPHIGVSWVHEFKDNSRRVTTAFTGAPGTPFETTIDGPDEDYLDCTIGVTAILGENVRLYLDYHTLAENDQVRNNTLRGGLRVSF